MSAEVIPTTPPIVHPVKDEISSDTYLGNDDFSSIEKRSPEMEELNGDDILEDAQPPPPPYSQSYSQWDELSIEQLLEKSREVITGHSEYLASGGDKKEKDGEMLEKITQVESLLQTILSDQTFAMHDMRSQLSDIHTVLKTMHGKQVTMTNEEVMTVKALTENIIASNEVNRQSDANENAEATVETTTTTTTRPSTSNVKIPIIEEFHLSNPTPALSAILSAPPNTIPTSQQPSRVPSRNTSRVPSRVPSRAPSRTPSRPPSKSTSRAVSPNRTSSRSSSKHKPVSKINEENEDDEGTGDTSLDRMVKILSSLITEATEAVEKPVVGREKRLRRISNSNPGLNFDDINQALDALEEEDENEEELESDSSESDEEEEIEEIDDDDDDRGRSLKREKTHKRGKSTHELNFEDKMFEFGQSLNAFSNLVEEMTTEGQDESMVQENYGLQYLDSTADLIKNPSENLADLDDFSQQCRLLTRAFLLPFLWATHNFMSESLQTNLHQSNGVKSTLRTFMNLMYWTFLFTLGSLVLDAWLCEVAGRQVIRMVDSLKPSQPFGMIYGVGEQESEYSYRSDRRNSSDYRALEEDKKKKRQILYRP